MGKYWKIRSILKRVFFAVGTLFIIAAYQNCGVFDASDSASFSENSKLDVSFEQFDKVVQANCVHCHGGADSLSPGTLNFKVLTSEAAWLNHPSDLIVPGSRPQSSMYYRLIHAAGKVPSQKNNMPFAAAGYPVVMTAADAEIIGGYIDTLGNGEPSKIVDTSTGYSALAKAKYLVSGKAVTSSEVSSLVASDKSVDREALKAQVSQWLETPEGKAKLIDFFRMTLNQDGWTYPEAGTLLLGRIRPQGTGSGRNQRRFIWEENLKESFARTALRLVEEGRPFSDIVTTTERVVTSAVLSTLSFADGARGGIVLRNEREDPFNDHIKNLPLSDFRDWRVVNFRQQNGVTNFNNMNAIRRVDEGENYNLRIPRVGFFNTIAFQMKFPTNDDNDFRVTASEMLIVALDEIFEAGDPTPNGNISSLEGGHAEPNTDCFRCHRLLDPIKETFKTSYDQFYLYSDALEVRNPNFNFANHSGPSNTIPELAETVSTHPLFANGWASKLCAYANSTPCDENSSDFLSIVDAFKASNLDFKVLVAEVMSSPVVTAKGGGVLSDSEGTNGGANSGLISIARRNHICQALNTRYREALALQNLDDPLGSQDLCDLNDEIASVVSGLSTGGTNRGEAGLSQPAIATALSSQFIEHLCLELSEVLVGGRGSAFNGSSRATSESANKNLVNLIMGLPDNHPRYPASLQSINEVYDYGVGTVNLSSQDALRESFVFACSSPDVAGVGL